MEIHIGQVAQNEPRHRLNGESPELEIIMHEIGQDLWTPDAKKQFAMTIWKAIWEAAWKAIWDRRNSERQFGR